MTRAIIRNLCAVIMAVMAFLTAMAPYNFNLDDLQEVITLGSSAEAAPGKGLFLPKGGLELSPLQRALQSARDADWECTFWEEADIWFCWNQELCPSFSKGMAGADFDGDGYAGQEVYLLHCVGLDELEESLPRGFVEAYYRPWDCDDSNPSIHPGAEEICGNNIDDNCRRGTWDECILDLCNGVDEDGDGQIDEDAEDHLFTNQICADNGEICRDMRDNNHDGQVDEGCPCDPLFCPYSPVGDAYCSADGHCAYGNPDQPWNGMVHVAEEHTSFVMGSDDRPGGRREYEGPARNVSLGYSFFADLAPANVSDYEDCVAAGMCLAPTQLVNGATNHSDRDPLLPANAVDQRDAIAYCEWRGTELGDGWTGRLPTESELHLLMSGGGESQSLYPWGDATPTPEVVGMNLNRALPFDDERLVEHPGPFGHVGLNDLNYWTGSCWTHDLSTLDEFGDINQDACDGMTVVVKGGGYNRTEANAEEGFGASYRGQVQPNARDQGWWLDHGQRFGIPPCVYTYEAPPFMWDPNAPL